MGLTTYRKKRNFKKTAEPSGTKPAPLKKRKSALPIFVVQKHAASRLHYDFRLEMNGVLASWAVPKGPSLNPGEKRLAVHVEDHPLDYGSFEGIIPEGEYGAGQVIVWDTGTWEFQSENSLKADMTKGSLKFALNGKKLKGSWALVRMRNRPDDKGDNWLLIKHEDKYSTTAEDKEITELKPRSVLSRALIKEKPAKDSNSKKTTSNTKRGK